MRSRYTLYAVAVFVVFILGCGKFPESIFQLAPESRLPGWFISSRKLTRSDFTVQMAYYTSPLGRVAVFTLWDGFGNKLDEVEGQQRGYGPIESLKAGCPDGDAKLRLGESRVCPRYEVITARGVTEIIEHKIFGPVFHITDDPAIRQWLTPDAGESRENGGPMPSPAAPVQIPPSRSKCVGEPEGDADLAVARAKREGLILPSCVAENGASKIRGQNLS